MDRRLLSANCSSTPWPTTTSTAVKIQQGVIMVCTPDLYYQEFKAEGAELRAWKHKFLKRLDMYHELMHDEKERTTPMKAEDFTK